MAPKTEVKVIPLGLFLDYLKDSLLGDWVLVLGDTPCKEIVLSLFEKHQLDVVRVVCGNYITTYFFVRREAVKSKFSLGEKMGDAANYVRVILSYREDGRCNLSFMGHWDSKLVVKGIDDVISRYVVYECAEGNVIAAKLSN